jgi:hypothetical protein
VGLLIIGSGIVGCDSYSDLLVDRLLSNIEFLDFVTAIAGNIITGFTQ